MRMIESTKDDNTYYKTRYFNTIDHYLNNPIVRECPDLMEGSQVYIDLFRDCLHSIEILPINLKDFSDIFKKIARDTKEYVIYAYNKKSHSFKLHKVSKVKFSYAYLNKYSRCELVWAVAPQVERDLLKKIGDNSIFVQGLLQDTPIYFSNYFIMCKSITYLTHLFMKKPPEFAHVIVSPPNIENRKQLNRFIYDCKHFRTNSPLIQHRLSIIERGVYNWRRTREAVNTIYNNIEIGIAQQVDLLNKISALENRRPKGAMSEKLKKEEAMLYRFAKQELTNHYYNKIT